MGDLKVTDRRMFTPDGRLREPYERELAESAAEAAAEASANPEAAEAPPAGAAAAASVEPEVPSPAVPAPAPPGLPALPAEPPPGFLELVDFLAQLALVSMGDAPYADGRIVRDLAASRFYIDLIGAFHERYALRLSTQELQFLETSLDQLRLRFVARSGSGNVG